MLLTNSSNSINAFVPAVSFQLPEFVNNLFSDKKEDLKSELVKTISSTSNGKTATMDTQRMVLNLVGELERDYPSSPTILTDQKLADELLNGTWYLQYTQPSVIDDDDDDTSTEIKKEEPTVREYNGDYKAKGSVSASGITVDIAGKVPKQIFNTATSMVRNEVDLDNSIQVMVGGPFRPSSEVPVRAIVSFVEGSISYQNLNIPLDFLFATLAFFRGGNTDTGWLETTFCDEDLRIGRGDKGSLFVLTRDPTLVK